MTQQQPHIICVLITSHGASRLFTMSDPKPPAKNVQPAELVGTLFRIKKDDRGKEVRTPCTHLGKPSFKLTYVCLHENCNQEVNIVEKTGKTALKTHFKCAHCGGSEAKLYDNLKTTELNNADGLNVFTIRTGPSDDEVAMFEWLKYIIANSRPFSDCDNPSIRTFSKFPPVTSKKLQEILQEVVKLVNKKI